MVRSARKFLNTYKGKRVTVRTSAVCLAAVVVLTWCDGVASASTARLLMPPTAAYPSACKTVSYTGDGGYYSQGQFYWEPNDTVTLTTHWCYANGVITSFAVTYTTTIPNSLDPRLSPSAGLVKGGAVLDVGIAGDYNAGVLNNVGFISIVGHVTRRGHHHFVNNPNAGG